MKSFKVKDKWRTNPLSEKPGGSTLFVEESGRIMIYDKIKCTWAYIRQIKKNECVTRVWLQDKDGNSSKLLWQRK